MYDDRGQLKGLNHFGQDFRTNDNPSETSTVLAGLSRSKARAESGMVFA